MFEGNSKGIAGANSPPGVIPESKDPCYRQRNFRVKLAIAN
jgi:hypothetical protein